LTEETDIVRRMEAAGAAILETLAEHGCEAYLVGGCVRDRVMGRPLKDIDIATSALPEKVAGMFPRTIPTGLQHGTVTVVMDSIPFEVTTFRKESDYEQFRRPQRVEFVDDLTEDLRRRDFTINAMALDRFGSLVDPFGGVQDIEARLLRCVGDPKERFGEDALRMLRALRFAAAYGLRIDEPTWKALMDMRILLKHIAMERVRVELERMLEGHDPVRAVQLLAESGILDFTKEPLGLPALRWDAQLAQASQLLAQTSEPDLRWTIFFMLLPVEASAAGAAMDGLRFPRRRQERIQRIMAFQEWIRQISLYYEPDRLKAKARFQEMALRYSKAIAADWLRLPPESADASRLKHEAAAWLDDMSIDQVQELAVSGKDILEAENRRPGPWLGILLDRLLRDVVLGGVPNDKESLLRQARRYRDRLPSLDKE
jgi:tRNA nucleotidyltransferase (CCA-adding enzyme)